MKQNLKKLKGTTLTVSQGIVVTLTNSYKDNELADNQIYFQTTCETIQCKVFDLEEEDTQDCFRNEKQIYESNHYPQLATFISAASFHLRTGHFGVIFLAKIPSNSQIMCLFSSLDLLSLLDTLLTFIHRLKQQNQAFLNLNFNTIHYTLDGRFCIVDPNFITLAGQFENVVGNNEELIQNINKNFHFYAPEVLQKNDIIDYKSDLFAVGCIIFYFLYHRYPFQSRKEAIISKCPTLDDSFLGQLASCLIAPRQKRASLQEIQSRVSAQIFSLKKNEINITNSVSTAKTKTTMLSNLNYMISKMTTDTQGWFHSFTENNADIPKDKHLNLLIGKLNRSEKKICKLLQIMKNCISENNTSCIYFNCKLAFLFMHLLRRTPRGLFTDWTDVWAALKFAAQKDWRVNVIIDVLRDKFKLHRVIPNFFRGNFYVGDFAAFAKEEPTYFHKIIEYINSLVNKINHVLPNNQTELDIYCIKLLCDQLLDSFSSVLLGIISIEKDQKLKLRRNNCPQWQNIKQKISPLLQKISILSNSVDQHPIYALEMSYYSYQEQLNLKFTPQHTALQYFYKYLPEYKGLCVPVNFYIGHSSNNSKQFISNQFQNQSQRSPKSIPRKLQTRKKKISQTSSVKGVQLKLNNNQMKPTVPFDQFFQIANQSQKSSLQKVTQQTLSENNFSLFDEILENKKQKQRRPTITKNALEEFAKFSFDNIYDRSISQPQTNIFNLNWKPDISPPSPLLSFVLSGLKLKQLKEKLKEKQHLIKIYNTLQFGKLLATGNAGEVYLGKIDNKTVAIKKARIRQNPTALKQFQRQLLTYVKIQNNPYLVSFVGLSRENQDYFLITEYCTRGSLFELLHKKALQIPLSWKQKIELATQIAKGMNALHEMVPPIIHRDLKSLNVLVSEVDSRFIAKVADFGLSRTADFGMMTNCLGTLHWMAPELLENKQYSLKADVYSFGIVLWEICARKTPYNQLVNPMAIVKHVTINQKRPLLTALPIDTHPNLITLMQKCWIQEPEMRPDFASVIKILTTTLVQ